MEGVRREGEQQRGRRTGLSPHGGLAQGPARRARQARSRPRSTALPHPYLVVSGSSGAPLPFRLGWKEQKLDEKGKDPLSAEARPFHPRQTFPEPGRDWVLAASPTRPSRAADLGVPGSSPRAAGSAHAAVATVTVLKQQPQ